MSDSRIVLKTFEDGENARVSKQLYKFRAISPDTSTYVSRIFTHNELYFPIAAQLNDPWESRPRVRTSGKRWTVVEHGDMHEVPPDLLGYDRKYADPTSTFILHKYKIDPEQLAFIRSRVGKPSSYGTLFRDHPNFRLCSFSATERHPLLWAHYADAHRGVCIGFDTAIGQFGGAHKIEYQAEYPVFPEISDHFTMLDAERAALLHKSDVWSYEDEYRLLTGLYGGNEPSFLNRQNVLCFSSEAIVSVIFGCAMSNANKSLIRRWLGARCHSVNIFQARVADHRYELVFDQLS